MTHESDDALPAILFVVFALICIAFAIGSANLERDEARSCVDRERRQ